MGKSTHAIRLIEILTATVKGRDQIVWNGRRVETLLVIYRSDAGSGLGSGERPRGKLWVRPDGTVVKQEVMILNSTMTFGRMSDAEAAELWRRVGGHFE